MPKHQVPINSIPEQRWPFTPFRTHDTQILDTRNQPVTLVGVNWPGHGLPMVPEGLQYQSIEAIVAKVKSLGMNVVRLTYATELVDDIFESNGRDMGLEASFVKALGRSNGTRIYEQVIKLNPKLAGDGVTRLHVFDAVAEELARQHIYVHLDNHISKAGWCCSLDDGDGWFGDTHFDTTRWVRGLKYMTHHASKWRAFISTSLRNEPRDTPDNPTIHSTYNWATWYDNMVPALTAVHASNPDPLIFVSGMGFDTNLEPVIRGDYLGSGRHFSLHSLDKGLQGKVVWELHNYNNSATSCVALMDLLEKAGYYTLPRPAQQALSANDANLAPIVMTEFGFAQDKQGVDSVYANCLKEFLGNLRASWMYWVIVGSYYERQGIQDYDESWGLLDHEWREWRDGKVVDGYFRELVDDVLGLTDGE